MKPPNSNHQSPPSNLQPSIFNHQSPIPNLQSPPVDLQSASFTFSQNSLQAYVDCPRRFQLRYLFRLTWPAPEAQPILEHEEHLQRGQAFHKLIQQFLIGMTPQRLDQFASSDPLLAQWWRDFMSENPIPEASTRYAEINLSLPIGKHRIAARYDLLAVADQATLIFDWKTNQYYPKKETIQGKLQSRVYPFVLIEAGKILNQGKNIDPSQVEMIYWFSNYPDSPIHSRYDHEKYEQDRMYLSKMVDTISSLEQDGFPRTKNLDHCRYCVYRSFCDRGKEAGSVEDLEAVYALEGGLVEDIDLELDLDQIAEIEF